MAYSSARRKRAAARRRKAAQAQPEATGVTEVFIECSDCGDPMLSQGDYLCHSCRRLLDEEHRMSVKVEEEYWNSHGRWEQMRKEAMLSGYQQAITR